MKKIININLSGRVVPIEDSAYEKLQEYIESLRRYFANEEGRDEIINDIESRIAELMSEKVRKGADSITDADVNEIANSMGRPEDFEGEEIKEQSYTSSASSAGPTQQSSQAQAAPKEKRRLYRERRTCAELRGLRLVSNQPRLSSRRALHQGCDAARASGRQHLRRYRHLPD